MHACTHARLPAAPANLSVERPVLGVVGAQLDVDPELLAVQWADTDSAPQRRVAVGRFPELPDVAAAARGRGELVEAGRLRANATGGQP